MLYIKQYPRQTLQTIARSIMCTTDSCYPFLMDSLTMTISLVLANPVQVRKFRTTHMKSKFVVLQKSLESQIRKPPFTSAKFPKRPQGHLCKAPQSMSSVTV